MKFGHITRLRKAELDSAISALEQELAASGRISEKKRLKLHELTIERSNRKHKTPQAHIVRG